MPTLLTANDWARLQEIFDAAVDLSSAQRAAYLNSACLNTPEMRLRVESLLASFEEETQVGRLVGSAAAETMQASLPGIGGRLGPYKIMSVLGRGGMGIVYRAVRDDEEYQKEVAIKVAATGMLTPDLHQRFLRERQILANLDHPNIARLLDGGTTPEGLPFVVMEFVAGKPIDIYCSEAALDKRARIRLMIKVTRAVDFAHRHLVVHRDLKPDNIHVTQDGHPKLLDFGIAKALDPEATGLQGSQTLDAMRLMTPDYASPEQVRGEAITTATDVYQLGVLLYLLLTGKRPFEATTRNMGELEHTICETPPAKPNLNADLDRILLQALEKDPRRRYSSAEAFAEDMERYLDGYPVHARTPSWRYATVKFIGRHRLAVSSATLFVLLLAGFAVGVTIFARRAAQQARIATQTTDFLLGLFQANDPLQGRGDKITARELLDKGAAELDKSGDQDPVVRVKLLDSLGYIYDSLGNSQQARQMLQKSIELRETKLPRDDVALADTLSLLGIVEYKLSNFEQARKLDERALAIYKAKLPATDDRLASEPTYFSEALIELNQFPQAESYEREAAAFCTRTKGPKDHDTLAILGDLSYLLLREGKYAEAYTITREILANEQTQLRPDHPQLCYDWASVGSAAGALGRFEEAEQAMRNQLSICLQSYNADNPQVDEARLNLGAILIPRGKLQEAESLSRQALAGYMKVYGPTHNKTASAEAYTGDVLLAEGKPAEAREHIETALQARLKVVPDTLAVVQTWRRLAQVDYATGNLAQALQDISSGLEILHRKFPDGQNDQLVTSESELAEILTAQGNWNAAEKVAHSALDSSRNQFPEGNPKIGAAASALGWAYYLDGKTAEGCPALQSALTIDEGTYGRMAPQTAQTAIRLAACAQASGRQVEADTLIREYRATLLASPDPTYHMEKQWLNQHPFIAKAT